MIGSKQKSELQWAPLCVIIGSNDSKSLWQKYKFTDFNFYIIIIIRKDRQCKAEREWYTHPISPKTPATQYQPIDRKKRKGKKVEDYSRDRAA